MAFCGKFHYVRSYTQPDFFKRRILSGAFSAPPCHPFDTASRSADLQNLSWNS
jgi:hypothetical protein